MDARWDRAVLYAEIDEPHHALREVQAVAKRRPGDPECVKMLARLYHRLRQPSKAISVRGHGEHVVCFCRGV